MAVKKYEDAGCGPVDMEESDDGVWVMAADYEKLHNAVKALLNDVKARYPGQDLYCPFMRQLEELTK